MNSRHTPREKDSYLRNELAVFYIDNNRKIIVSETTHCNKVYIDIRHWLKTTENQKLGWLPSRKGMFFTVESGLTFWDELNKIVSHQLDKYSGLSNKVAQII